ncbi:MAG TPA: hypothetical protein VLG38_04145, partial [Gammaproteobacteria bacterium]|nr:hypothetical protein [Gammaproteobacteria bacterium]
MVRSNALLLYHAKIVVDITSINVDKFFTLGDSELIIGEQARFGIDDPCGLISPEEAGILSKGSQIAIKEFDATCPIKIDNSRIFIDNLNVKNRLALSRCDINVRIKTHILQEGLLALLKSEMQSHLFISDGGLDEIESDVYVDDHLTIALTSTTKLTSSNLCGGNVQIFGKVLITPEGAVANGVQVYESRIISYAPQNINGAAIPANSTSKVTSKNFLRRYIESISLPTNNPHLRRLQTPSEHSRAYTLLVSVLFGGICADQRVRIVGLLASCYLEHNSKVPLAVGGEFSDADFVAFMQKYKDTHDVGNIKLFMDSYCQENGSGYHVTKLLALCMQQAVLEHAVLAMIGPEKPLSFMQSLSLYLTPPRPGSRRARRMDEYKTQRLAALNELEQHPFLYAQYAVSYLKAQNIDCTIKHINIYAYADEAMFWHGAHETDNTSKQISVAWYESYLGQFEPELDMRKLAAIKFSAPFGARDNVSLAYKLREIISVFCYYTNLDPVALFGIEDGAAIQQELFAVRRDMNAPGGLVLHEEASIDGTLGEIYAAKVLILDCKSNLKDPLLFAKKIEIGVAGALEGGKSATLHAQEFTGINGSAQADNLILIGDHIVPSGYVSGRSSLHVDALTLLPYGAYVHSANFVPDIVVNFNLGINHTFNTYIDALVSFQGISLPCMPYSIDDVFSAQKMFTLAKMGIGFASTPAAVMLQGITRGLSFAQALYRMQTVWWDLRGKIWHNELSFSDTKALIKTLKRAFNEGLGFYRIAPLVQARSLADNAASVVDAVSEQGLSAVLNSGLNSLSQSGQQARAIFDQASADINDLRQQRNADPTFIPGRDWLKTKPALKDVFDTAADVVAVVAPSQHADTLLSLGGVEASGSISSQNVVTLNVGLTLAANYSNQSVYQRNMLPSRFWSYNYTTATMRADDHGTVEAVNWHLEAGEWNQSGTTNALVKIFDVRYAYIGPKAKFLGNGKTIGHVEDLLVAGRVDFPNGIITADNSIVFIESADLNTPNMLFKARNMQNRGRWRYGDTLFVEAEDFALDAGSVFNGTSGASYGLHSIRAKFAGKESHHDAYISVDEMPVDEMRNYVIGIGDYANRVDFTNSVIGVTKRTENLEFAGNRVNGALADVRTGGSVTLAYHYERARGHQFPSYAAAAAVVANYHNYNLPPPKPKKKGWFKKT